MFLNTICRKAAFIPNWKKFENSPSRLLFVLLRNVTLVEQPIYILSPRTKKCTFALKFTMWNMTKLLALMNGQLTTWLVLIYLFKLLIFYFRNMDFQCPVSFKDSDKFLIGIFSCSTRVFPRLEN